jgi:hypothetical protein
MRYLSILLGFVLLSLTALSCIQRTLPSSPVNNDVLNFKDFYLTAESVKLNTNVKGTIFVKRNGENADKKHIQISARVEIDPRDWGGVSFYFPQGWNVSGITSDYPQGNPGPERYTTTLSSGGEARLVYIGNSKMSASSNGGEGDIIIDLDPVSTNKDLPEDLVITVGVGSEGEVVVNPVSQKIMVPLNIDYRTPSRPVSTVNTEADYLIISTGGQAVRVPEDTQQFSQISRGAVKIIEGVNGSIYATQSDQAKIQRTIQTGDFLEIGFDTPVEITTSRIIRYQWETVSLSSAIFFLSGDYYGLVAWPDEGQTGRYEVYSSSVQIKALEKMVKNAKIQYAAE